MSENTVERKILIDIALALGYVDDGTLDLEFLKGLPEDIRAIGNRLWGPRRSADKFKAEIDISALLKKLRGGTSQFSYVDPKCSLEDTMQAAADTIIKLNNRFANARNIVLDEVKEILFWMK